MKKILLCILVSIYTQTSIAQFVYKIKADSVMITRDSCTAELIIENSTKNVPGFLYNKGNGRTEFRRSVRLNDSTLILGEDTVVIQGTGKMTARNGLSIKNDRIVLGGELNSPYNFAGLIDDREIHMGEQLIRFKGLGASYLQIYEIPGDGVSLQLSSKADYQPPSRISFLDHSDYLNPTEGKIFKNEDRLTLEVANGAIGLIDYNGDVNFSAYPDDRDDGETNKALYTDVNGNIKLGTINASGYVKRTTINNTGYTALTTDYLIAFTALTAGRTVTLPPATGMTNRIIIVKDESGQAGTHNITINVTAGGTIDGVTSKLINTNYGSIEVYSNGSQWFVK